MLSSAWVFSETLKTTQRVQMKQNECFPWESATL